MYLVRPDGALLTIDNLPASATRRWVAQRKAEVVAAVRGGLLSLQEACRRYDLTPDEFAGWQEGMDRFGLRGLYATSPRDRRSASPGPDAAPGIVIAFPASPAAWPKTIVAAAVPQPIVA